MKALINLIARLSSLRIGIDSKKRLFVVSSKTGKHYSLFAGIFCWAVGALMTTFGCFATIVAPVGIIEASQEFSVVTIVYAAISMAISATIAYAGMKLYCTFEHKAGWIGEPECRI